MRAGEALMPMSEDQLRRIFAEGGPDWDCTLKWVMSERMTNQTLRERFHLPESKVASISQVISATLEAKLVKLDEKARGSRKFARYLPFWA